jgi:hypothetical protein
LSGGRQGFTAPVATVCSDRGSRRFRFLRLAADRGADVAGLDAAAALVAIAFRDAIAAHR